MRDAKLASHGLDPLLRYEALLRISKAIAHHRTVADLLRALSDHLHAVVPFDSLMLVLHDLPTDEMRLVVLEPTDLPMPSFCPMPASDARAARAVFESQRAAVTALPQDAPPGSALEFLHTRDTQVTCWLPLTTAHRRVGVLALGSRDPDQYPADAVAFMEQVAAHVAIAVDNATNVDDARRLEREVRGERDRLRLLLEVSNLLVSRLSYPELLQSLSDSLQRVVTHDSASLALFDGPSNQLWLQALTYAKGCEVLEPHTALPLEGSPSGLVFERGVARVFREAELTPFSPDTTAALQAAGVTSLCCLPLVTLRGRLGTLNVGSVNREAFPRDDVELLTQIATQLAIAVENALAYQAITGLRDQLALEKDYLEREILLEHDFSDIIGDSPALKRALQAVERVAPTDTTVLLLGETGTGKELLARAIHHLSPRRERTFVRLSAAALPATLIESELFGYEKGAFTGATTTKIGLLELAHHGTLFLDEVGDIPLDVQPKLLRLLQEREFQRLGSTRPQRVDLRLIAATNRDLWQMMADGLFRSDLFYRLNVFPLPVPALRDRREDIPALVRHFVDSFSRRMKRSIPIIPVATMAALQRALWPGNIREIKNVIERAVILSPGPELKVPLADLHPAPAGGGEASASRGQFHNAERELIVKALRDSRGVVGGPEGAASKLGLQRTTLQSKMRKLGITRGSY